MEIKSDKVEFPNELLDDVNHIREWVSQSLSHRACMLLISDDTIGFCGVSLGNRNNTSAMIHSISEKDKDVREVLFYSAIFSMINAEGESKTVDCFAKALELINQINNGNTKK
jgi:hypothetical protein